MISTIEFDPNFTFSHLDWLRLIPKPPIRVRELAQEAPEIRVDEYRGGDHPEEKEEVEGSVDKHSLVNI